MSLQTYDTHELLGVVNTLYRPHTYWLDLCFPVSHFANDEWINFDIVTGGRKLAPFVAPTVQGKVIASRGYKTERFKPAYLKPKAAVTPDRFIKRRAGEPLMGTLSPGQRRDAVIADIMQEQKEMLVRRQEWMAAQAVINGAVTVAGEDYPTTVVDFGRDAGQSVVLLTTDQWDDYTNSDPLGDLEAWCLQVQSKSGRRPTRVTMGTEAYSFFKDHPDVKDKLDTRYRGSSDNVNRSLMVPEDDSPAAYAGRLGSNLDVWVYSDIYEDDAGAEQQFLDPKKVVLTSPGVDGVRCFGAILDARAGYQPLEFFPKNWLNEDPSVEYIMTQSAPLMVPTRPNASLVATVL